jgi:hypothetical protein
MTEESEAHVTPPELNRSVLLTPHSIALITIWLLTTVSLVVMLLGGVRTSGQIRVERYILQVAYVLALLWYLARSGPSISQLPKIPPFVFPRWKYGPWIGVLGLILIFALTAISDDGLLILILLSIIATVWILLVWRRDIKLRSVIQALAVALFAYLGSLPLLNGFFSETMFNLLMILVAPMYIAGGLLVTRTGLGGVQLWAKRYRHVLRSFLLGCLLFVPLGLFNAAGGSPGSDITWMNELWMPFWLPKFPAITEETWFRLLLVGISYFLLRPAFPTRPALPILGAVLFSGITFGLLHDRTLEGFLTTGLLYGLPMAVAFARRDWEHAVGAHYMINMIPWLMVFLET